MKTLLIGINSKYIHPTLSIYQLAYNTTYPVTLKEFTIKDNVDKIVNYIINEKPDLVVPGGKGANQAIAAARAGAKVVILTKLGNDEKGKIILENLKKNNHPKGESVERVS